jgi:hypothetical protein
MCFSRSEAGWKQTQIAPRTFDPLGVLRRDDSDAGAGEKHGERQGQRPRAPLPHRSSPAPPPPFLPSLPLHARLWSEERGEIGRVGEVVGRSWDPRQAGRRGDPGVKKDGRDVGTWEAVVVAAACSRALAVGGAEEMVDAKFPPSIVNARPVGKARGSFSARFSAYHLAGQQSVHGWRRFGEGFTSASDFRFLSLSFHQTWTGPLAGLATVPYKNETLYFNRSFEPVITVGASSSWCSILYFCCHSLSLSLVSSTTSICFLFKKINQAMVVGIFPLHMERARMMVHSTAHDS